jgi:hypothetical protein
MPAAPAAGGAGCDGLKINYALMRTTELKMLWKMVKSGEKRKLSAADLALLWRIRLALREYESKIEAEQRQCKNE